MRSQQMNANLTGSFERVWDQSSSTFSIGGVSVCVLGDREADVNLGSPLGPFRVKHQHSDIQIQVQWLPELNVSQTPQLFESGAVWRVHSDSTDLRFDFSTPHLGLQPYKSLLVDHSFRRAILQLNKEYLSDSVYPLVPLEYPLDELLIMHRLTQERAIELHGSGIVRSNGVANLFIGHSGAGKSTTTRLWTETEDVEVLSDDRIIVRRDNDAPVGKASLNAGGAARKHEVLRFAQDDKKFRMRMYGTPWHGEAMFASPNSAPLTRIFVLEHGHGNVITPLSPSQAVAELFARSFVPFHQHEYVDSALEFLQELVNAVPVYRYAFEPDQRAVEKIRNFHD